MTYQRKPGCTDFQGGAPKCPQVKVGPSAGCHQAVCFGLRASFSPGVSAGWFQRRERGPTFPGNGLSASLCPPLPPSLLPNQRLSRLVCYRHATLLLQTRLNDSWGGGERNTHIFTAAHAHTQIHTPLRGTTGRPFAPHRTRRAQSPKVVRIFQRKTHSRESNL